MRFFLNKIVLLKKKNYFIHKPRQTTIIGKQLIFFWDLKCLKKTGNVLKVAMFKQ